MRYVAVVASVLMSGVFASQSWAQNCKPTMSQEDKITKQQVDVWAQELWSTSFLSSVVNTSETGITGTIGRYGSVNAFNLEIKKKEESATNAAFDAAYRGAAGKTIFLGFKNGEPLGLVISEVNNAANVQQGLFGGKGVTTVVLSAIVPDRDLARLRDQLTTRPIDAVRFDLSGDLQIDKSVSEGDGKKMMEKFKCFYQALDKKGINLAADAGPLPSDFATSTVELASVAGKYINKEKPDDYFQLEPNGISLSPLSGTLKYSVQGDLLSFLAPEGKSFKLADGRLVKVIQGRLIGNAYVSSDGTRYERIATPAKPADTQLTIDQIIKWVTAKIPDDVIIASIAKSGVKYEPEDLIRLKSAGASDGVIRAVAK